MRPLRGLLRASHPLPSLSVTAFASAWGLAVGLEPATVAALAVAVLLGHLSIAWSNDWVDAPRDTAAGRTDKAVPAGLVRRRTLGLAALAALAACVAASSLLGPPAAVVNVTTVLVAWAYNYPVKATVLSPLPYAVSFGLLPAVATLAAEPPALPAGATLAGAALLGVGAHFANTVGDTEADAATAVRGLPQRLGPHRSLLVMVGCVAVAAVVLLLGAGRPNPVGLGLLATGALAAGGAAAIGWRRIEGPTAFRLTVGAVGLVVAGVVVSG